MAPYSMRFTPARAEHLRKNANESESDGESDGDNAAMTANYMELKNQTKKQLDKIKLAIKRELSSDHSDGVNSKDLEDLEDYYERAIQMRMMRVTTLEEELKSEKEKTIALTERVVKVRDIAKMRKFQAKVWLMLTTCSIFEVWFPGTTLYAGRNFIVPALKELIYGTSTLSYWARSALGLHVAGYYILMSGAHKIARKLINLSPF
uniref:Uncharacterized protein n=1 Tax=viral metagenome TaxID=1070528 RepID=A0A6C0KBT5_9ZZZZ